MRRCRAPIEPTFYVRFGDGPAHLVVLAALAVVLWRRWRHD